MGGGGREGNKWEEIERGQWEEGRREGRRKEGGGEEKYK